MKKSRYNFLLSPTLLKKWQNFAEEYDLSGSSLIRLSVNDYIKKKEKEGTINQMEQVNNDAKRDLKETIDNIGDKLGNFVDKMEAKEDLKKKFEQRDRLKSQTLAILERFPSGLTSKDLSELLALDRPELESFLLYMSDSSLINKKKGVVTLK